MAFRAFLSTFGSPFLSSFGLPAPSSSMQVSSKTNTAFASDCSGQIHFGTHFFARQAATIASDCSFVEKMNGSPFFIAHPGTCNGSLLPSGSNGTKRMLWAGCCQNSPDHACLSVLSDPGKKPSLVRSPVPTQIWGVPGPMAPSDSARTSLDRIAMPMPLGLGFVAPVLARLGGEGWLLLVFMADMFVVCE